jgi:energy-coupling factor transporter ATP-binding protein EcfA2
MFMDNLSQRVIKGYELRDLIGSGGFGAIYVAYQTLLDREVAIKAVHPEHANHPEFIRRFAAEAQLIARLEHLHIVPLYDYWRDPDGAFLVMRYLRGGDLHATLSKGAWEVHAVAQLLDQIASALSVAHRKGVVHQDVKPSNILLDQEGNAYLTDFGIAKDVVGRGEPAPQEVSYGSPLYMSPEAILRQQVSPRSDIYSLGIVLYQILTGRVPFVDPDTEVIIRQQVNDPVPPLQYIRPELPEALNMVIRRATAKTSEARYRDVMELAADFRRAIGAIPHSVQIPTAEEAAAGGNKETQTRPLPNRDTMVFSSTLAPTNPYKGLRPFMEADQADFFGRSILIGRLLDRMAVTGGSRFVALVGPSGCGKSSVVNAGLLPALRRGHASGSHNWFFATMTPGSEPFEQLATALLQVAQETPDDLVTRLAVDITALTEVMPVILPDPETELLLVIDQFEELFTLVTDEHARTHFLDSLYHAVTVEGSRIRLLLTLRADFYDRPLLYPNFSALFQTNTEVVTPLTPAELAQAITGPAERIGLHVEEGLVAAMTADVSRQPGALPLLQYALTELYEQRDGESLTQYGYRTSGGVAGALARRAESLYLEATFPERETIRQLFLRLVALGDESEVTRRRLRWSAFIELAPNMADVVERFSRYRLLTLDHDPTTREPTVEVAHEALLQAWIRLREWVTLNREDLLVYRRLAAAAHEWQQSNREAGYLAAGGRLAQFETLVARGCGLPHSGGESLRGCRDCAASAHHTPQPAVRGRAGGVFADYAGGSGDRHPAGACG